MLPKVILHNALSVDGRNGGFLPELGRFYGLAARWKEHATLVGSGTILAAPEGLEADEPGAPPLAPPDRKDRRPLLAVVDSEGRVRCWRALVGSGYWKAGVAILSRSTPVAHREYLKTAGVEWIAVGRGKVDLRKALELLRARFGARTVRADTGGTLNGHLLRMGLVSEVSVLVHPVLVGDASKGFLVQGPILGKDGKPVALRLLSCEEKDGFVWLRYAARK